LSIEQIGLWAGFIFTLMIFSYVLGDNVLYRIAVYVFAGLAAGFMALVTLDTVILPWVNGTIFQPGVNPLVQASGIIPFILALLLLIKTSPRLGRLGNLALAVIVGVGTAVSLVGVISGTLIPLTISTGSEIRVQPLNGFLIFLGVVCTLAYFNVLGRRRADGGVERSLLNRTMSAVGQFFVIITLAALYAGAILTSLTIFSERIGFILARITGG
jgi:hypothetical protein